MKKFLKIMLCIMGSLLAVIVAFWFSISYTVNYKKITCDTSVSPDKKYEVILQAVGEPEWPFGSASGRLVLKEGEDKISQTDFELHNDGASISSSCWKVTWHEDYALYYGVASCSDCSIWVLHFVYGKLQEDNLRYICFSRWKI